MNRQIVFKSRPEGMPKTTDFEIKETSVPELKDGEAKVKAKYISVDPYMRGRMSSAKSYTAGFELNTPMAGGVVGEVVESRYPDLKKGDFVLGNMPWQEIQNISGDELTKVDKDLAPLGYYLGILGMPGLTAYFGLNEIGEPREGETVVVSGAAGAVGLAVSQIARIKGCRVVGIAGSEEKISYLKNEIGVDEAINYKNTGNIAEALASACPNGVDVYFDNVGGEISDAVLSLINKHARIIICGQISLYNSTTQPTGPRIQPLLLKSSAQMQGFIVREYARRFPEGMQQLAAWLNEGKLKYHQTIVKGFEKLPETFIGLFEGKNTGKMLVEL
ncbi:MAG TPA: NADP-dependent oxidoreductase [Bacteroidales bacterium]|nr:NADP-dependent oxidoreductase [Bacteroidales bacterium]